MTGWVVERMPRAALSSSGPSCATAPMPPHSQGAERRGRRWALRALVIGGLAGAAWLLTGAAAHAAGNDPETTGPSLLGSIVHGDTTSVVDRVLRVAAQPLDTVRDTERNLVGKTIVGTTLGEVTKSRDLTGPLRLTGGPADPEQLAPVAAPLTKTLRTVTATLPQAAESEAPAEADAPRAQAPAATPVTRDAAATRTADHTPAAPGAPTGLTTDRRAQAAPVEFVERRHSIVTERHAMTASASEPVRDPMPGGDVPAPPKVQLGASSGLSTTASGAPTEGGSAAYLPAAVASSSVDSHRLRQATDVEARRNDAVAPTVSPD